MLQRTAKSCGPDAPTLASSSRRQVGPTGLRHAISAGDGGKQAWSPGRARRKPLKPLRAGTSGDSGVLVVTRVRSTTTKCTRGRGCQGHPAFPTPSQGRKIQQRLGRIAPRGRSRVRNESNVIGPSSDPCPPSQGASGWRQPLVRSISDGHLIFRRICPSFGGPGRASPKPPFFCCEQVGPCYKPAARGIAAGPDAILAGVAELVDALDLGSSDESCGGSSPSARTKR
jgi:hypothetical protein